MPVVESSVVIDVDPATAFAVSQTTGEVRLRWDPFIDGFARGCADLVVLAAVRG